MNNQTNQHPRSNSGQRDFLTVKDVSAYLAIGVSTVWRQVKNGALPKPIRIGGSTRWRSADIEALLDPKHTN